MTRLWRRGAWRVCALGRSSSRDALMHRRLPGGGGVIFFGAVVTDELLRVHDELHRAMGDVGQGAWPYYATGAWSLTAP